MPTLCRYAAQGGSTRGARAASGDLSLATVPVVRLIVARCEARYTGRLDTFLPEALRLVMIKSDGSVMIHADDTGGYKPQNWMTPRPRSRRSRREGDEPAMIVVTKHAGATEDRVEIKIAEVLST